MSVARHSLAALAAAAVAPAALVALALRPSLRAGLGERLGQHPGAALRPSPIWVHGASVGEIRAALGLVDALRARGDTVVASSMTATGRALARSLRPDLACGLAPLDHPWCVDRALARVAPRALVLVETELWPSWVKAAVARGVRVVVVSGRISDRSFGRYRRVRPLLARTLARFSAVGARSEADAERFVALGAPRERVRVTGDLKLEPIEAASELPPELAAALAGPPLFVAGSTHEGEEAAALAALAAAEAAGHPLALVVAPRHPETFERAAQLLAASGRRLLRRSALAGARVAPGDVLLLDSIGELAGLWPHAEVAFVGGTLAPVGGHNVLEPVLAGRAVLFGRYTEKCREAATLALACGAGVQVASERELAAATLLALGDLAAWRARGAAGRRAASAHRGATARSLALLDAALAEVSR